MKDLLLYPDTVYGHMLAAITSIYLKKKFPKHEVMYYPNMHCAPTSRFVVPFKQIDRDSIVWFLGDTPAQKAMVDIKTENKPKKILWWDYHVSKIARVFEDEEAAGMDKYEGIRTENPCLGVQLWEYCFPNDPVPPCIYWVDNFMQGKADFSARAFYYGLGLIETDPGELAKYPEVSADSNNPANFWEAAFSVRIPFDLDNPTRQCEDELTNRLTWDATYQVMNMGSVVDTYLRIKTKWWLDHDWFSIYWITEKVPMLLINTREADLETIKVWCKEMFVNVPYAGYYYLENTQTDDWRIYICRITESRACIDYARLHIDAWGNESVASFKTNVLYNKLGLIANNSGGKGGKGKITKADNNSNNSDV